MTSNLTDIANALGTDKGTAIGDWGTSHNYTQVYEALLKDRRKRPLNVLEIGVWRGASLRMWEEYLPNANIVGIDILADTLKQASDRSKVIIGDAGDPAFLRRVATTAFSGPIDLVVDDGSHALDHQVTALKALFPFLADAGLYVVEDTAVSRFDLKVVNVAPFVDFHDCAAELAAQTTFFPDAPKSGYNTVRDVNALNDYEQRQIVPSYWNRWLHSVSFFYNMCVLVKGERKLAVPLAEGSEGALDVPPGAAWREKAAEARLAEAPAHDDAGDILRRTAEALDAVAMKVSVVAALARHAERPSEALAETLSALDHMLDDFRRQLTDAKRESSRSALELRESRSAFERTVARLAKAEAEVEYLRQQLSILAENVPAAPQAELPPEPNAASSEDPEADPPAPITETERPKPVAAVAIQESAEDLDLAGAAIKGGAGTEAAALGYAERISELEDEVAMNAAELAQVRLIHGGLWESHRYATAELEACRRDAASLREDLYRERSESGHLIWEAEQKHEDFERKIEELTGYSRWLTEEQRVSTETANAKLNAARSRFDELDGRARRLEQERDAARREADSGRLREQALLATASWRLTAPLRWAKLRRLSGTPTGIR